MAYQSRAMNRPIDRFAYIIRQLKHPEEVKLLRQVYGKQFVLVSAYAPEDKRQRRLLDDIKASESTKACRTSNSKFVD
jgi:hypothetical protein